MQEKFMRAAQLVFPPRVGAYLIHNGRYRGPTDCDLTTDHCQITVRHRNPTAPQTSVRAHLSLHVATNTIVTLIRLILLLLSPFPFVSCFFPPSVPRRNRSIVDVPSPPIPTRWTMPKC